MNVISLAGKQAQLTIDENELLILNSALNEICNGISVPEFETRKIWHRLLHDQTGLILRQRLIMSENVIVSTIPFHLEK